MTAFKTDGGKFTLDQIVWEHTPIPEIRPDRQPTGLGPRTGIRRARVTCHECRPIATSWVDESWGSQREIGSYEVVCPRCGARDSMDHDVLFGRRERKRSTIPPPPRA
jgi:hypothetical protein